jgi:hypothetical protein
MEYMAGGELYDRLFQQRVYKEDAATLGGMRPDNGVYRPKMMSNSRWNGY